MDSGYRVIGRVSYNLSRPGMSSLAGAQCPDLRDVRGQGESLHCVQGEFDDALAIGFITEAGAEGAASTARVDAPAQPGVRR